MLTCAGFCIDCPPLSSRCNRQRHLLRLKHQRERQTRYRRRRRKPPQQHRVNRHTQCCLKPQKPSLRTLQKTSLLWSSAAAGPLYNHSMSSVARKRRDCLQGLSPAAWFAKHFSGACCSHAQQTTTLPHHTQSKSTRSINAAVPFPLALVVAWEVAICAASALLSTKLILGAALIFLHANLCSGDAQRVHWGSLQLSTQGLRAAAYATKTTKVGQPFACAACGAASVTAQRSRPGF